MLVVLFGVHSHTVPQAIIAYKISPAGVGGGGGGGGGGWIMPEAIAALIPTVTSTPLCFAIILEMSPINLRRKSCMFLCFKVRVQPLICVKVKPS